MSQSEYHGIYEYKGWTIWNPAEKEWIAEPDWSEQAVVNYKAKAKKRFTTIAKAKKWVREEGVKLKEKDFI